MSMIRAKNITRTFTNDSIKTKVLKGIDLEIQKGEYVAIMGKSGSGKSTLLYQLSLLDRPSSGEVYLNDHPSDFAKASSLARSQFRLFQLGYVFQEYALLPELTSVENVMLPMLMQKMNRVDAYKRAKTALSKVRLKEHLDKIPSQMSGGEQQRVAIARAVAGNVAILFADEPTANLDTDNASEVLGIFEELHKKGQTIVMITHEKDYGKMAERIITLEDGHILSDRKVRRRVKVKRG